MLDNHTTSALYGLVCPPALVPALIDTYGSRYGNWLAANPTVVTSPAAAQLLDQRLAPEALESLIKYGDVGVIDALFALDEREGDSVITTGLGWTILRYWYLDPDKYWRVDAALGSSGPWNGDERRPKSAIVARREVEVEPPGKPRGPHAKLRALNEPYHDVEQTLRFAGDELIRILGEGDTPQSQAAWMTFIHQMLITPAATLANVAEVALALTTNE